MKKTLLATAIAGAMAASGAQAATVYNQDGTKLDIYGNIQIAYYDTNNAAGDSQDGIADNGTTFGFAAEHVISQGLTGYLKLEFDDIKADEMKTAVDNDDSGDTAYVGLRGDFGDVRVGSYDQLIDDWIQDPITNNEGFDVSDSTGAHGGGADQETDKVTYTSPSLGGFQFAVGTQYKGDFDSADGGDADEGDSNASFFGGAKYTMGAFSVAAVYDNLDNINYTTTGGDVESVGDQYGVTAQYTIDTLRLSAKWETFDADQEDSDVDFAALGARYGYGMGDVYGAYQNVDSEGSDDDRDEVIIGANYSISDAMYTWVEAAWYDKENDEDDGVGVGITYLF
ncbi:porin [Halomonas beimenensis]|uniref:Outer membrane protein (Porin) n=1 Tax=Halomonas beimenensis TaxID=475662 RepID=A0A291PA65_9GAMM|nr:porin [Halomonas beimenensis]ATJ83803.1 outer membrane protein (porin) [Halomonas beimenensis]